jgi:hypothetical protein
MCRLSGRAPTGPMVYLPDPLGCLAEERGRDRQAEPPSRVKDESDGAALHRNILQRSYEKTAHMKRLGRECSRT